MALHTRYFTKTKSTNEIVGSPTGYDTLNLAQQWMRHLRAKHADTIVVDQNGTVITQ